MRSWPDLPPMTSRAADGGALGVAGRGRHRDRSLGRRLRARRRATRRSSSTRGASTGSRAQRRQGMSGRRTTRGPRAVDRGLDVGRSSTGAAGFIGSHLVDALLERGARVRVLDNLSNGQRENLAHCADRIEFIEGDIRDVEACRRACAEHRRRVPPGRPRLRAALDEGSGDEHRRQRRRDRQRLRRRPRRGRPAGRLCLLLERLRRQHALPKKEGEEGAPLSPVRALQGDERGARRRLRAAATGWSSSACATSTSTARGRIPTALRRGDPAVLPGLPVGRGAGHLRRRRAEPRLHLRGRRGRGEPAARRRRPPAACGRAYNVAGGHQTSVNELARAVREAVGGGPAPRHEAPRAGDVLHSAADLRCSPGAAGYCPARGLGRGLWPIARTTTAVWSEAGGRR